MELDSANILQCPYEKDYKIKDGDLFSEIAKVCKDVPDLPALIDSVNENAPITYGELYSKSMKLAAYIYERGFRKNSVLAAVSYTCADMVVVTVATWCLGGVFAAINTQASEDEIHRQLKLCKAHFVFYDETLCAPVLGGCERTLVKHLIVNFSTTGKPTSGEDGPSPPTSAVDSHACLDDILKSDEVEPRESPTIIPVDDVALILFSSGTTGTSKGVAITHSNLINICSQTSHPNLTPSNYGQYDILFQPLSHIFGFHVLFYCILLKKSVFLMKKFDFYNYLCFISKYKISTLRIVTPIVSLLAKHPLIEKFDLSCIKYIYSGSTTCSLSLQNELIKRFNNLGYSLKLFGQGYGLTESCSLISLSSYMAADENGGSIGYVMPGASVKIVDIDTKVNLPAMEKGEIYVKGPQVMKGYVDNKEQTDLVLDNGWLKTGDLGYYNQNGFLYIVDRIKDLLKYNAYQVSPSEIEELLNGHESVQDSAVYGKFDEAHGDIPSALVVLKEDVTSSDEVKNELMQIVKDKLAKYKFLRGGIDFVKSIPRSPSGKLQRNLLNTITSKL